MITREQARKIFAKYGIKEVPPDDPIYKEPPSIRFVNRPGKPDKAGRQTLKRERHERE